MTGDQRAPVIGLPSELHFHFSLIGTLTNCKTDTLRKKCPL
jgi:hypothetical protein